MSIPNGFVISLVPNRLSVMLVSRGRVQQSESTSLPSQDWSELWADGLMQLDLPLRQLLSRFPKRSLSNTTLIYESKTLTKQITTDEQGGAFARDTARSKLREMVGLDTQVCVTPLGSDTASSGPTLMLAYADRDDTLRSLYAWLNRCGVSVSGMIPSSVASVVVAAQQAESLDDETAIFYLDGHCGVLCYSAGNRLKLVRPTDIGFNKLAESYQQVFQEHHAKESGPDAPPQCCVQDALNCLVENGIPFQPQQYKGIELRSGVLPRMAPVLQRIGIDVKQTIRFGIGGETKLKNLIVAGPGAAIPNITRAVSEHLELHMKLAAGHEGFEPAVAGGFGTTEQQFIELSKSIPVLLPRIAGDERSRKQLQQAVGIGAVVAAVAVAGQFLNYTSQRSHFESEIQNDSARYQRVAQFEQMQEQAHEVHGMLGDISKLVASHTESQPYWETPLAEIGQFVGSGIRIQELRGEYDSGTPVLVILGYSISEGKLSAGQVLDQFVERIGKIDHVGAVRMGATTRIDVSTQQGENNAWGSQFTLKVMLQNRYSPYEAFANASEGQADWTQP